MDNQLIIEPDPAKRGLRYKLNEIIFGTDTTLGKLFDVVLLITILLSVLVVILESVPTISAQIGKELKIIEWIFTILFTIEYILRIFSAANPIKYIFSFLGIIDLLAITPAFLSVFFKGSHAFTVIRSFRLIRVFRIFKLARYTKGANVIGQALKASMPKITVFLVAVVSLTIIMGTMMYFFEGSQNSGFSSIPKSIYWAIVTLTTVGYGDTVPFTIMGQITASIIMILGYGIIAVPTGIVSSEFIQEKKTKLLFKCSSCGIEGHDKDAEYCKNCGDKL